VWLVLLNLNACDLVESSSCLWIFLIMSGVLKSCNSRMVILVI
jgi:hypothetical protein